MDTPLILETTFLVDLEREAARHQEGAACAFLQQHEDRPLVITFTVAGEIAAGMSARRRSEWEQFLAPFRILWCSPEVCWHYGEVYRYLSSNGMLIGGNDLWIAATALAHGLPLVTRDEGHFRRVPHLDVIGYAAAPTPPTHAG